MAPAITATNGVIGKNYEGMDLNNSDTQSNSLGYFTVPMGKEGKDQAAVLGYNTSQNGLNVLV